MNIDNLKIDLTSKGVVMFVPDFSNEKPCEWAELIIQKYINALNRKEPITAKEDAIKGISSWFQQAFIQGKMAWVTVFICYGF